METVKHHPHRQESYGISLKKEKKVHKSRKDRCSLGLTEDLGILSIVLTSLGEGGGGIFRVNVCECVMLC